MPIATTYPGVYIEEIPSGVRTITGVSTSVGGFVGSAKRGPVGVARHIFAFSDYERTFGGLDQSSEMSYAVRQFFLNGGQEAWVVRAAGNAVAASRTLQNTTPVPVLDVTALSAGATGNTIQVFVDNDTNVPDSTFNLTFVYPSLDDPTNATRETFKNLSMNSADSRFVVNVINGASNLATVALHGGGLPALINARSQSGLLSDPDLPNILPNPTDTGSIQVVINNDPPVVVTFSHSDVANAAAVASRIQTVIQAAGYASFSVSAPSVGTFHRVVCTLNPTSANGDTIRILPGPTRDISAALKLGAGNGGGEVDSFHDRRPAAILASGTIFGEELTSIDVDNLHGGAPGGTLRIALDGDSNHLIHLDDHTGIADWRQRLAAIAQDIAAKVQAVAPSVALKQAYANFSVGVGRDNALRLQSGSAGPGSAIALTTGDASDVSAALKLTSPGAVVVGGQVAPLQNGTEVDPPWTPGVETTAYLGTPGGPPQGIYALDPADFNLLVLAGVFNDAITAAAADFCQHRRAFYIADPRPGQTPDQMATYMIGPSLPRSEYGAVYYPYVQVADPLAGGTLRSTPPSGTIAGVYARTDASRGVWKAPAGTDATLLGVNGLETVINDGQNGTLNQLGLNAIRIFPIYGVIAWGARTFRGADVVASDYKYVPVRRLALYIEESLFRGTKWVVFEPNDEPLWAQIRLNVGAFMQNLFRQGAFQGATPRQAYFVKCDSTTTTQNDINLGVVNIIVGFAPLKPAEFVVIQIQQIAGQLAA